VPTRKFLLTLEPIPGCILASMGANNKPMRAGELARLAGVSSDTLRHYERIGILPKAPRTASGYRMYPLDSLVRVNLVQRALQLGFTLSELSEILCARDRGEAPCGRVLALTEEKLCDVSRRIKELNQTQSVIQSLVRDWRAQLARTAPGKQARLLQSLPAKPSRPTQPLNNLKRRSK
jgi:MerR family transcriptional regulator, copper efflux regulator